MLHFVFFALAKLHYVSWTHSFCWHVSPIFSTVSVRKRQSAFPYSEIKVLLQNKQWIATLTPSRMRGASTSSGSRFFVEFTIGKVGTGHITFPVIFIVELMQLSFEASCLITYQAEHDCIAHARTAKHARKRKSIALSFKRCFGKPLPGRWPLCKPSFLLAQLIQWRS